MCSSTLAAPTTEEIPRSIQRRDIANCYCNIGQSIQSEGGIALYELERLILENSQYCTDGLRTDSIFDPSQTLEFQIINAESYQICNKATTLQSFVKTMADYSATNCNNGGVTCQDTYYAEQFYALYGTGA